MSPVAGSFRRSGAPNRGRIAGHLDLGDWAKRSVMLMSVKSKEHEGTNIELHSQIHDPKNIYR